MIMYIVLTERFFGFVPFQPVIIIHGGRGLCCVILTKYDPGYHCISEFSHGDSELDIERVTSLVIKRRPRNVILFNLVPVPF